MCMCIAITTPHGKCEWGWGGCCVSICGGRGLLALGYLGLWQAKMRKAGVGALAQVRPSAKCLVVQSWVSGGPHGFVAISLDSHC